MAQTTDSITFRNVLVELSSDGSTWFDVSGSVSGVTVNGGERQKLEIRPLFADSVKMETGARERVGVVVKSVYTENPTEAYAILDAAYLTRSDIYLRWIPAGNTPGALRYFTVGAKVVKPAYPNGDVNEAKPLMVDYELSAETIDKDVNA